MGEIFRELQEESKERETRAAFERWMAERGTPLPLEHPQAYEAFKAGMERQSCMTAVRMFQAEGAALAQPETEAEPVAWEVRYVDGMNGEDAVFLTSMPEIYDGDSQHYKIRPLYAHPPRDSEQKEKS